MEFSTIGWSSMLGTKVFESVLVNFLKNLQLVAAEADHFDVEIIVDEFEFFAQGDKGLMLAQEAAQDIGELSRPRRAPCPDRNG